MLMYESAPRAGNCLIQLFWRSAGCIGVLLVTGCASNQPVTHSPKRATSRPYIINGQAYYPQPHFELTEEGIASHYGGGDGFHGCRTASGSRFSMHEFTAAHRTLPLPCIILVENLHNGRKAKLLVNDRGPFKKNRILDVSARAAQALGFYKQGLARVRITTLVAESLCLPQNRCLLYKKGQLLPKAIASQSLPTEHLVERVIQKHVPTYLHVASPSLSHALSLEEKLRSYGPTQLRKEKKGVQAYYKVLIGPLDPQHASRLMPQLVKSGCRNIKLASE